MNRATQGVGCHTNRRVLEWNHAAAVPFDCQQTLQLNHATAARLSCPHRADKAYAGRFMGDSSQQASMSSL